jgi:hypothetical protein
MLVLSIPFERVSAREFAASDYFADCDRGVKISSSFTVLAINLQLQICCSLAVRSGAVQRPDV